MTDLELINKELEGRIESVVKPLNNPVRLRMLILLHHAPLSYSEMLEELQIESGSFYWHIKKMKGLVQQHADKRYSLTHLGEKAYELLLDERVEQTVPDDEPMWYIPLKSIVSALYSSVFTSVPLLFISVVMTYMFGLRMQELGMNQVGINTSTNEYPFSEYSALISLASISGIFLGALLYSKKYLGDGRKNGLINWIKLTSLVIAFVTLSMLSVAHIYLPTEAIQVLGDRRFAIIVFSSVSLLTSIILLTALGDVALGFGFKNSLIFVLVIYYPVVIISFVLS